MHNILANYASQGYGLLLNLAMTPLYLRYMGVEAYGLIGFFATLQVWFSLLDMGLTPTLARESARFRGGKTDGMEYRQLVRALEGVFFVVAVIGSAFFYSASGLIAGGWLKVENLPLTEVVSSMRLMAGIIALRWMSGLYQGMINGAERMIWLGGFNSLIATLRFVCVLPILVMIGATPTVFFSFQLGVAVLELAGLFVYANRHMPVVPRGGSRAWSLAPLKPVIPFALTIAFTSSVWVLDTQVDKLILSKLLPLADYGYFMLAVLMAGGVLTISGPVSGALMPRMAKLEAEGRHDDLIRVYRQATQLVCIVAGAASVVLAFCAEPVLWVWTGDRGLARQCAPILSLYAIGNGILAVSAFPYYLQYAKGDLRLHLIGSAVFVALLTPAVVWASSKHGGVGAGVIWLLGNVIYFATWVPLTHQKFEPGLNKVWFGRDALVIGSVIVAVGWSLSRILPPTDNRWLAFFEIVIMGLFVMIAGAIASSAGWERTRLWLGGRRINLKGSA